jgi:hypothetical protein
LRLVLRTPIPVEVQTARPEGARFELLDELELVVARSPQTDALKLNIELIPGRYRARARDANGNLNREIPFEVVAKPLQVQVD